MTPVRSYRLGLVGAAITYSLSPVIHRAALRACGLAGEYELHDVPPAGVAGLADAVRRGEIDGLNVTIPHKLTAATLCDGLRGDAAITEVTNTLCRRDGRLVGENTDVLALQSVLREMEVSAQRGAAVVCGTGGAAAAAVLALTRLGWSEVSVVARRVSAAADLGKRLAGHASIVAMAWDRDTVAGVIEAAAVVVNATPLGADDLPFEVHSLHPAAAVVDLRYRPRPVDLVAAARERGIRAQDGLEMLIRQAATSFEFWTGMAPPLSALREAAASELGETSHR